MSKKVNNQGCNIYVKHFASTKTTCMKDYIQSSLRNAPNHFIFHAGTNDLGFYFQNCKHFLDYFGFYPLTAKVNFQFYKQCSQAATRFICERAVFALVSFFSSNISSIKKKSLGKIM